MLRFVDLFQRRVRCSSSSRPLTKAKLRAGPDLSRTGRAGQKPSAFRGFSRGARGERPTEQLLLKARRQHPLALVAAGARFPNERVLLQQVVEDLDRLRAVAAVRERPALREPPFGVV